MNEQLSSNTMSSLSFNENDKTYVRVSRIGNSRDTNIDKFDQG